MKQKSNYQLSIIIYVDQFNYRFLNPTLKQIQPTGVYHFLVVSSGFELDLKTLIDSDLMDKITIYQFPLIGFAKAINHILKQVKSPYYYFWPLGDRTFNLWPTYKLAIQLNANALWLANPNTYQLKWLKVVPINVDQDFANHPQMVSPWHCYFKRSLNLQFDEHFFICNFNLQLSSFFQDHPDKLYFYNHLINPNLIKTNQHPLSHWEFNWHYWQLITFATTTNLAKPINANQFVFQVKTLWHWSKKPLNKLDHFQIKLALKNCFLQPVKVQKWKWWWNFYRHYLKFVL